MQPTLCKKCRGRFYYAHDLGHVLPPSLSVTDLRNGIQISADVHAESMRQTLAGLIPKLDKYDAEIKELEETLAYLKHRRTDLAHSISVYKAYLAPIRRLPTELLCKIFLEACAFGDRSPIGTTYAKPSNHTPRPHFVSLQFAPTGEASPSLSPHSGPSCLLMLMTTTFQDQRENYSHYISRGHAPSQYTLEFLLKPSVIYGMTFPCCLTCL